MDKEKQSILGGRISFRHPELGSGSIPNETHNRRKAAFTLAEVLITLGIIGVVAAVTLPAFITNVNEHAKEKRMENIKQKLSKVTDKMASLDVLQGHQTTHDFVIEMKKHMSIAKICENNELAKCWPSKTVELDDGTKYDISEATKAKALKADDDNYHEWLDTMGIVTGDGTSMLISYNKKCSIGSDSGIKYDYSTAKSNTIGCLAVVYDWNGGGRPNKVGAKYDVLTMGGANGLATTCTYQFDGQCLKVPESPTEAEALAAQADCANLVSQGIIDQCFDSNFGDYYAAAAAKCGGKDKMFNKSDLDKIARYIYGEDNITYDDGDEHFETKENLGDDVAKRAAELGLPDPRSADFYVWSSEEIDSSSAYTRWFRSSETGGREYDRGSAYYLVLCKGD